MGVLPFDLTRDEGWVSFGDDDRRTTTDYRKAYILS
jgi:hypothetical protein